MRANITSPSDLGRLVRHIRQTHELTQRDLAARLGVSQRYLYELEAGKPKLADERYFSLIRSLGIDLSATTRDG